MKRFLLILIALFIPIAAFAQDIVPAPVDPDQLANLVKDGIAAVGAEKALGIAAAVLAGIAFVLRYLIALWRMDWIQSRLPAWAKWDSWKKLYQVIAVCAVTFLALFLGSLIQLGWRAALTAAAIAVVPIALAAMGVKAATKVAPVSP